MRGLNLHQPGLRHDPDWFRKAVFYEALVRGFRRRIQADPKISGDARDFFDRAAWSVLRVRF